MTSKLPPWLWKGALILYGVYIFALIAFYIGIAGRSVSYSYTVSGQPSVRAGSPAALRLGVYDIHRGHFLPRTDVEIEWVRGETAETVFRGLTSVAGLGDVNLRVPDVAPGPSAWRVTLQPMDMDAETVEIPVTVEAAASPDFTQRWADATLEVRSVDALGKPLPVDEGTGPVYIDMIAEGGVPVDALKSHILVQTTDRATGAPVSAKVTLTKGKGLVDGPVPSSVRTDGGGLGAFALTPIGSQDWTLTVTQRDAEGEPIVSTRRVNLKSEPTQYTMLLRDPVWDDGETLEVGVRSLHRRGALYGDVYMDGRWSHGEVTGLGERGGGFMLKPEATPRPTEGVWLAWVQVYGDALQPGAAGDARTVAVPAPGMSPRAVLTAVLDQAIAAGFQEERAKALRGSAWIQTAEDSALHRQLVWWLSHLPRALVQPPLLKDTQDDDRQTLSEEKEAFRAQVTWLLAVSGGLGLLLLLYLVVTHFIRVRLESQAMMLELEADALLADEASENFARTTAIFQLVLLFATITLFFVAIVVLLQAL